jgi:tRNA threonylcarbamoyladenosine modification (KEOPS) complex Cgi121 subunit
LVLVNGVEISALQQLETMVPSDADVVLIPVVHGGVRRVPLDGDNMVSILFCMRAKVSKPAVFLALLRSRVPGCLVQAFDAQSIGGLAHLAAVTRQTWEAKRRGHMLSRSAELDLIMRAAAHRQIKTALSAVGLRPGRPLVAIVVIGPRQHVAGLSCKDLGLLEPTRSAVRAGRRIRRDRLTATERRSAVGADAEALLLAEQAALLVR